MAVALEFKPRVRALPDLPSPRTRERRTPVMGLGLLGWALAVGLGLGIDRGYLPVKVWAARLEAATQRDGAAAPTDSEPEFAPAAPQRAPEFLAGGPLAAPSPAAAEEWTEGPVTAAASAPDRGDDPDDLPASGAPELAPPIDLARGVPPHRSRLDRGEPPISLREPEPLESRDPEPRAAHADSRRTSWDELPEETPVTRAEERSPPPAPPVMQDEPASTAGTSCEAAVAANEEEIVMGRRSAPDLTREQFGAILENGRWFGHCGVPARVAIDVCVAVRHGRAVGVTIQTRPRDRTAERCVAAAARGLSFPSNARLDVTRTTFSAE